VNERRRVIPPPFFFGVKKEIIVAGTGQMWALRMPGGPTRVIKSAKPISEDRAKKAYAESFAFKSAECLNDKEAVWPLCKVIDETEFRKNYSQFGEYNTRTHQPRGVVEV